MGTRSLENSKEPYVKLIFCPHNGNPNPDSNPIHEYEFSCSPSILCLENIIIIKNFECSIKLMKSVRVFTKKINRFVVNKEYDKRNINTRMIF